MQLFQPSGKGEILHYVPRHLGSLMGDWRHLPWWPISGIYDDFNKEY